MTGWPLVGAALALGLAVSPHCVLMCSAPCAAVTGGNARRAASLLAGRMVGYMAGGAVVAGSVQAFGAWSLAAPVLRPLWLLLHGGLLALGLWWLVTGRPLQGLDRAAALPLAVRVSVPAGVPMKMPLTVPITVPITVPLQRAGVGRPAAAATTGGRRPLLRASLAGLAWVAWPCGALHAALLLAALANSAAGGALVMAAFALASMPALALAPWAWARWVAWPERQRARREQIGQIGQGAQRGALSPWPALGWRLAGAALLLGSGAALGQGVWQRFAAWCGV